MAHMHRHAALGLVAAGILAIYPVSAAAQGVGIGPRFSFVRGDVTTGAPSTRFTGGILRMGSSRHVSIELALDYRSLLSTDGSQRVRQMPFQASLLIYPVRSVLAPYLLGGFGVYSEMTDSLDANGAVVATATTRHTGWHLGAGAEIFLARHVAIFGDYRFRFVRVGQADQGADPINVPGLSSLHLSHKGSMWTSGIAFYF